MTSWRRLLIAAPVVVFAATWPLIDGPGFRTDALAFITDAVTGWILVAAGLVTWSRRPDSRTGVWLVAAGYLWYVGDLYFVLPSVSIVPLLSFGLRGAYDVLLAAALLTFPGSRFSRRPARLAVLGVAATWGARAVTFLITARPGFGYPDNGTPNPFLLFDDGALAHNLDLDLTMARGVAILIVGLMAAVRLTRVSPATRRVLMPVTIGGVIWATTTFLVDLGALVDANVRGQLLPWAHAAWWPVPEYLVRGSAAPVGFLVGALMLRTARSAVVDLVTGFEGRPLRARLEPSLRSAIGDPGLRVLYPDGDTSWSDGTGRTAGAPTASPGIAATPIISHGQTRAVLLHDAALLEDPGLVGAVTATVRLAIDNEQLTEDLEAQLEETRASRRRIVDAADAERQRIERDLHDGAQQRLVSLAISLRMLGDSLGDEASSEVRDELSAAGTELREAIEELRELAHGLDPAILRESGLGPAVRSLAERCPTPTRVRIEFDGRLARPIEATAYFVVAEALTNVTKHASATAVAVSLRLDGGHLLVEVEDDGLGGASAASGSGLRGLADRVAAAGGRFDLGSVAGRGTRVAAVLPIGQ
ncbi:MAG TPA: histidine kinase [Candidatus Limnocylindrales bacterium]